jgi:hypothetical protein
MNSKNVGLSGKIFPGRLKLKRSKVGSPFESESDRVAGIFVARLKDRKE